MTSAPSHQPPKPLSDSPLFWLLLFGGMALAMAALIQPKFDQREARLERMYHSRQLAAQRSVAKANRPQSDATQPPPTSAEYRPGEPIITVRSLMFLLAALLLAAALAIVLMRRRPPSELLT
jgi:hypothetical protein